MDPSDSGRGSSSSSKRTRKRNDDAGKRTVRVPAQLFGNTEIPPEDGFTWRKYGQKEISGFKVSEGLLPVHAPEPVPLPGQETSSATR
ncbi:hypothetical protein OIU78_022773 [Salix suchowensis]|nr:hypothetical protein OIU78_022773 [Salix suchowensis]